ncbi:MAG: aldose 1-epimerase family protein [Pirellulales bacterium]
MAPRSAILMDQGAGRRWNDTWQLAGEARGARYQLRAKTFAGGLSDGVWGLEIDNGAWQIELLPSRGMSIWKARCGEVELGWKSPVRGPVHPSYVPLTEPSGLGWLDGFDELLVRCGLESNGAPDFDEQGKLLYPLHGKIGNRPAHRVQVTVDDQSGEITVTGEVAETRFHFLKLLLTTTLRTRIGSTRWELVDRVTNLSAVPADMQMLYHINLGLPLLDAGSRVIVPAKRVVPRNAHSAEHRAGWDHFGAEQAGFAEQVYFCELWPDAQGRTEVLLKNAHGTRGFSVGYRLAELPCFTLWKNTAAADDGYVTGLEPGTNFPNPRTFERQHNRQIQLAGGAHREFRVDCEYHATAAAVEATERRVSGLSQGQAELADGPLADWCA